MTRYTKIMMNSKQKAIYFGDMFGELEEERDDILDECEKYGVTFVKGIQHTDEPPFKEHFDVLFFDYGGMSIGNDMLGSFCRHILSEHKDHPSRYYVMVSLFTRESMKEAIEFFGEKPGNIFLTIEEFCKEYIK